MKPTHKPKHHGFTIVELLMVITIISILAAMLLPALEASLDSARTTQCQGNVKQFMTATIIYMDDTAGFIPEHSYASDTYGVRPWFYTNRLVQEKYLSDPAAVMCPTMPNSSYFRYHPQLPPWDRSNDSAITGNESWRAHWNTTFYTEVPMGTYFYMGGYSSRTGADNFANYSYWSLIYNRRMRTENVLNASRYALIWDFDQTRTHDTSAPTDSESKRQMNPHAKQPGHSFGFFDGHVTFVKNSLYPLSDVRFSTPVLSGAGNAWQYCEDTELNVWYAGGTYAPTKKSSKFGKVLRVHEP